MGVVYRAFDEERGAPVALKLLSEQRAEALVRFKREFRLLKEVRHPHLVHLGELFEQDGRWFYTMELIDGVDFLSWVRARTRPDDDTGAMTSPMLRPEDPTPTAPPAYLPPPKPPSFDEPRLRAALRQLAQGLAALHAVQKVHRDVKPTNVMVTPEGRVVLLDFGLATDADRPDRLESGATWSAPPCTWRRSRRASSGSVRRRTGTRSAACSTRR